jgi:hypothetical protein
MINSEEFEGEIKPSGTILKGKLQLPYISEENNDDDFEVIISLESDSPEKSGAKDIIRSNAIPILKRKIPQMLQELREGKLLCEI